jgi:hypothetical protein
VRRQAKAAPAAGLELFPLYGSAALEADVCPTTTRGLVTVDDATRHELRRAARFHREAAEKHAAAATRLDRLGWKKS